MILLTIPLVAQRVSLKGIIRDSAGERLPLAHVVITPDSVSFLADEQARFSITLTPGSKIISISHVGYEEFRFRFYIRRDTTISFQLTDRVNALEEVVVTGKRN